MAGREQQQPQRKQVLATYQGKLVDVTDPKYIEWYYLEYAPHQARQIRRYRAEHQRNIAAGGYMAASSLNSYTAQGGK